MGMQGVQAAPRAVVRGRQKRMIQCIRVGLSFTKCASEVIKNQLYCTNSLAIVSDGFCPGASVRGSFVWKALSGVVFVHTPFCQNTSVKTES